MRHGYDRKHDEIARKPDHPHRCDRRLKLRFELRPVITSNLPDELYALHATGGLVVNLQCPISTPASDEAICEEKHGDESQRRDDELIDECFGDGRAHTGGGWEPGRQDVEVVVVEDTRPADA